MTKPLKKPLVLVILDGWGYQEEQEHNAIAAANTPQWDEWWQSKPHLLLNASGKEVGLPDLQMGNSEVGHMHIGAGRVIYQDFSRINAAIDSREYFHNAVFLNLIDTLKKNNKTLQVLGLLSPGGVHSHENHLFAFLTLCHQQQFSNVRLHLFLDGRDTPPQSALVSIERLNQHLQNYPVAVTASISGRYFAMDRDKRWPRTEQAYQLITAGLSNHHFPDAKTAVSHFYQQGVYDEFIPLTCIGTPKTMEDGDAIFFFNFRADRARQLTEAFIEPGFSAFHRAVQPRLAQFVSMTSYAATLNTICAFPPILLKDTFGEIIAKNGLKQLRIAETEKYAHVTFFFNGGSELVFANEERILIPSPKVATYDLQPEMSALELTQTLTKLIAEDMYDVIICNFANADMVGHSGNFKAAVTAIETLDQCMQQLGKAVAAKNGFILITADHGNAEIMYDNAIHQPHTAHTCQPVPLLFVGDGWHFKEKSGTLIDVAPTLLTLLGITPPKVMTGKPLLVKNEG